MKKICIIHLQSSKRVQSYKRVREEEVALLITDIHAASVASKALNLTKRLLTLTNEILCRVALGRKHPRESRFGDMLNELSKLMGSFPVADFVPWLGWIDVLTGLDARVRRTSKKLDDFLEQVLEEHLSRKTSKSIDANEEDVDFVDILLSIKDEYDTSSNVATPLHKEHIKALILDMIVAGTETSFVTLEWAMTELIKHPTLLQKVQREIRDIVGSKEVVEEEDINRLTFLKATIKETLRLHAPVPLLLPRVATENTKLQGYDIPAGTRIMINSWAIARDPNYWDKPEEFLPERFIHSNVDFRGQHFQLSPFGVRRRVCPGIGFAVSVIECTLANLLHHFDWEVPEEMKDELLDMRESPGIIIRKKSALCLTMKLHSVELAEPF